ncbi:MAG: SDR family NAD(P)-dependent oxidoreductase, partial [Actinomycetes bacterium]
MSLPSTSPNSTAVVTGASSGIGAEIAKVLAARGQNLTLVARRTELLEQLAIELRDKWKVLVDVAPCDLSDATARKALIDGLESAGKQVTILVNNAGFG